MSDNATRIGRRLCFAGGFALLLLSATAVGQTTRHVDDDAAPGGDGLLWSTAHRFLQDALAVAVPGDEIRVAQGTYYPDRSSAKPTGSGDRNATFHMLPGVNIRGGYAGVGAANPDKRDVVCFETILSGDVDTDGMLNGNSYHVVTAEDVGDTAVLNGFTITLGNAAGAMTPLGAGQLIKNANPTILRCAFRSNGGPQGGGDLAVTGANPPAQPPNISNCIFEDNDAANGGGGAFCQLSATFANCLFEGNSAGEDPHRDARPQALLGTTPPGNTRRPRPCARRRGSP